MSDDDIHIELQADGNAQQAAKHMDWGVVVDENQGGIGVFVVGLDAAEAASLLRRAADAMGGA